MPCGTGKTYVSLLVAQDGKHKTVVVFVPSLALVRQVLAEYRARSSWKRWSAIAVCSDPSVVDDGLYIAPDEVGCVVTTDSNIIKTFLSQDGVRVVFCTYQSASLLNGLRLELGIFDEAHRTAGRQGKAFAFALSDKNVQIKKRLFMTATPRHARATDDGEVPVFSMDDEKLYGSVAYRLDFRKAIDLGLICDYEIIICPLIEDVNTDGEKAAQVALRKAMVNYGARRAFTFHSTVERARSFAEDRHGAIYDYRKFHINGAMSTSQREPMLSQMVAHGGIVTNVRCLSEGVDFPAVDVVAFIDPKRSVIDIVQAIGRCLRKDRNNEKKKSYILVPIYIPRKLTEEESIRKSKFGPLYDVLQAIREQDKVLEADLRQASERAMVTGDTGNIDRISVLGYSEETLDVLQRAITVRLVKIVSGIKAADIKKQLLLKMAHRGASRPHWNTRIGIALSSYVSAVRDSYDIYFDQKIRRLAPNWFTSSADLNKKILLKMARRGDSRPNSKTRIGNALVHYTNRPTDAAFDQEIRRLAPQWFVNTTNENKKILFSVAHGRRPKPHYKTKLGIALRVYTTPGGSFDKFFNKKIRHLAPHWFTSSADRNKKILLEMARRSASRPLSNTKIGNVLLKYTGSKFKLSGTGFDQEIRRLAPQWFIDTVDENKNILLEMARRGNARPKERTELGSKLQRYSSPNSRSYDDAFDEEVRHLAPHWFINSADQNKKILLEMARRGEPKPLGRKNKASALNDYTSETRSFDTVFNRKIRRIAPHWFINSADQNKKILLEMARRGEPKPLGRKNKTASALRDYTSETRSFDTVFNRKIRRITPHWFINSVDQNKKILLDMARRGDPKPYYTTKIGNALKRYINNNKSSTYSYDAIFRQKILRLAPHWLK
jgi:superfamily II DNA or RNA helicase